jgi:hypothetical protein
LTLPVLKATVFKKNPEFYDDFIAQVKEHVTRSALAALGI